MDGRGGGAVAEITPLILTCDEAPNIARCLESLTWAPRVIVLDSGSTDGTPEIVRGFPNAEIHTRIFDNHTAQWNHGVSLVRTPWVLSLDADYVLAESFAAEAGAVVQQAGLDAAFSTFRYRIFGRPLRASLYPSRAVLFRTDRCRYEPDGHTQRLTIPGRSVVMTSVIDHDDRKPLSRWLASQDKYAVLEVDKLLATPRERLSFQDRLRRSVVLGPPAVFAYTLIVKGALFDGWPGWYYTLQRTLAELLLSLRLLDRRLRKQNEGPPRH